MSDDNVFGRHPSADSGRHRSADEQDAMLPSIGDDAYVYALDAVDAEERLEIERRVAASDAATRAAFGDIVASVRETVALTASVDATAPPAGLRSAILDEVASTRQDGTLAPADRVSDSRFPTDPIPTVRPGVPLSSQPVPLEAQPTEFIPVVDDADTAPVVSLDDRRRRRRWRMASVAAAAVLVVGVGGVVVSQQLNDGPTGTTTSTVLAADDVRTATVDVEGGGTATVRWSRSQDAAVVTLDGLATPAPDRVFEMWLIGQDPAPRPVGLVDPSAAATGSEHVLTDLSDATTFAVSVEPESGSPAPTTTPIAAVTLDA